MTTFNHLRKIRIAVFFTTALISSLAAQQSTPTAAMDAREIVRRSAEVDNRNWEKARNYTCQEREVEKKLDKNDAVKSTETRTNDITFYYGHEHYHMMPDNDQPL